MTRLFESKHVWIALVLATRCLIAPLRSAPNLAASLRTVETRYRDTYKITRHTLAPSHLVAEVTEDGDAWLERGDR